MYNHENERTYHHPYTLGEMRHADTTRGLVTVVRFYAEASLLLMIESDNEFPL